MDHSLIPSFSGLSDQLVLFRPADYTWYTQGG